MKERVNNSWGCPFEENGMCNRVKGKACDPGMKGCILAGRFVFSDPSKNRPGGPRRRGDARTLEPANARPLALLGVTSDVQEPKK